MVAVVGFEPSRCERERAARCTRRPLPSPNERERSLAEGEGFEPPEPFPVQWFSRPPPSTTRPSLRGKIWPQCAGLSPFATGSPVSVTASVTIGTARDDTQQAGWMEEWTLVAGSRVNTRKAKPKEWSDRCHAFREMKREWDNRLGRYLRPATGQIPGRT